MGLSDDLAENFDSRVTVCSESIDRLKGLDFEKLKRRDLSANFVGVVEHVFHPTCLLFCEFDKPTLRALPTRVIDHIHAKSSELHGLSTRLEAFSVGSDAEHQRENLSRDIVDICEKVLREVGLATIATNLGGRHGFRALLSDAANDSQDRKAAWATFKKRADEQLAAIELSGAAATDAINRANEALRIAGEAAAREGLLRYGEAFRSEARKHGRVALAWGAGAVVLFGVTLSFLWKVLHTAFVALPPMKEGDPRASVFLVEIAQQATVRLLFVSVLAYGIVWCARNFSASKHNQVVNQHRHDALTTFETFVQQSQADAHVKQTVLEQAMGAFFPFQPSGYSDKVPQILPHLSIVDTGRTKE